MTWVSESGPDDARLRRGEGLFHTMQHDPKRAVSREKAKKTPMTPMAISLVSIVWYRTSLQAEGGERTLHSSRSLSLVELRRSTLGHNNSTVRLEDGGR